MIVPTFWAEARERHRDGRRQVTVRRFGWSDASEADAQAMAQARASEALQRLLAGEPLARRERKLAYNGATGVPIREEVLSRHGEEVVTRNAYGAHCLNSPRALFADIDLAPPRRARHGRVVFGVLATICVGIGLALHRWGLAGGLLLAAAALSGAVASAIERAVVALRGGARHLARQRILAHLARHPDWALRLYETPAGLRLLATHRPFAPDAPDVREFFDAVGADPVYVRMCLNQHCFRARLTGKPWRMGIAGHMRPRPGIWPVDPSRRPVRDAWVRRYEAVAPGYAACRFVESLGAGTVHLDLRAVVDLHDRACQASKTALPLA
jgi:hypothetical protein